MSNLRQAATIMLVREKPTGGLEVLLLRRNRKLKFGPGFWVFPGGKIEEADRMATQNVVEAAKLAAVREAQEEAGITLSTADLSYFCHWTTPIIQPKRFATSFFYAVIQDQNLKITIDDSEIKEHLWLSPQEAIERSNKRTLALMPPTYLALQRISKCTKEQEVRAELDRFQPKVLPTIAMKDNLIYCLYEGDSAFKGGDIDTTGAKHRLIGAIDGNYQFIYEDCEVPAVNGGNHV